MGLSELLTLKNKAQLNEKANKTQDAWIAPTLQNNWVNYGGAYQTVGYMKDQFGFVHLQGLIKNGTTTPASVIFILPVGYRPTKDIIVNVCTSTAGGDGSVTILANGEVQVGTVYATYTSFNNIKFATF